jgi:tetratricopeptide (TPR) repeat protein
MKKLTCFLLGVTCLPGIYLPSAVSAADCEQDLSGFSTENFVSYQADSAPEWKKIWDRARTLYSQKKYDQARIQYELLLAGKDNIDQARWEYVTVLICRKQFQQAEAELALLLSHDPDRWEYQLARAEVALGSGDFSNAVELYAQLYVRQCAAAGSPEDRVHILSGYIDALDGLGRFTSLIPLMEQLAALRPADTELKLRIAETAIKIGQSRKALVIYRGLAKMHPENLKVFQALARVLTTMGSKKEAGAYWQQVIGIDAGNREANSQLITYYQEEGNLSMELRHVEQQLLLVPDDAELLARAGQLNIALDRPDRAIGFYDCLLNLQPGNREIEQQKDRALHDFAANLLDLIENTGSSLLWQDLVQVTNDRIGVYHALADMLRVQGRRAALIQVLLVIHNEVPGDTVIGEELASLLKEQTGSDILASSGEGDSTPSDILSQ